MKLKYDLEQNTIRERLGISEDRVIEMMKFAENLSEESAELRGDERDEAKRIFVFKYLEQTNSSEELLYFAMTYSSLIETLQARATERMLVNSINKFFGK